ncbi:FAD-dependent oxidoreductase [Candidatus Saccharibacteria bacterium]|nr:FAD-dependent oxidoreductase [Candidatus Saccharibacteria bacterium]
MPGLRSIYFKRPNNFVFESGDWIDISFEGKELKGGATYSISSSPTETDIRITFREGLSEFKKALQSLKGGEQLLISQYGNDYDFRLKSNQPSILIAGGVGIAPFRSMIKEMYDNNDKNKVTLIYFNQNNNFLFRTELDGWSTEMPHVSIEYIVTKDINRKKRDKLFLTLVKDPNQNFYIAGPPTMVESYEHLLVDAGIQVRNIRIDSFGGY